MNNKRTTIRDVGLMLLDDLVAKLLEDVSCTKDCVIFEPCKHRAYELIDDIILKLNCVRRNFFALSSMLISDPSNLATSVQMNSTGPMVAPTNEQRSNVPYVQHEHIQNTLLTQPSLVNYWSYTIANATPINQATLNFAFHDETQRFFACSVTNEPAPPANPSAALAPHLQSVNPSSACVNLSSKGFNLPHVNNVKPGQRAITVANNRPNSERNQKSTFTNSISNIVNETPRVCPSTVAANPPEGLSIPRLEKPSHQTNTSTASPPHSGNGVDSKKAPRYRILLPKVTKEPPETITNCWSTILTSGVPPLPYSTKENPSLSSPTPKETRKRTARESRGFNEFIYCNEQSLSNLPKSSLVNCYAQGCDEITESEEELSIIEQGATKNKKRKLNEDGEVLFATSVLNMKIDSNHS